MLSILDCHHELGRLEGVAALWVDGEITLWGRGAPVAARYPIGSLSKTITAAAALHCLDLAAPIARYLPDGMVAWGDRVTVHQCLAHTAGIPSLFKAHAGVPSATIERVTAPIERHELVGYFGSTPLRFEPGTDFEYSNSGYVLLALAIEHATGQPFHAHLARELTAGTTIGPLVPDELAVPPFLDGVPAPIIHPTWQLGAGDLVATVEDVVRWHARTHLPAMLEHHTPAYGYGYRLGVRAGRRVAWHEGLLPGLVATVHRALDRDVIAALIVPRVRASGHTLFTRMWLNRVADQLIAVGCGEHPPDAPRGPGRLPAEALVALPGRYPIDAARTLVFEIANGELQARAEGPWLLQGAAGVREPDEQRVAQLAGRLLAAMQQGAWDAVYAMSSSVLRTLVTRDGLAQAWADVVAQLGAVTEAIPLLVCGGIAWSRLRFASGVERDLRIVSDEDGRSVGGVYVDLPGLLPASASLPLRLDGNLMYADGFGAGVPDAWIDISDGGELRITRKYC